jgi:hypothetical protein
MKWFFYGFGIALCIALLMEKASAEEMDQDDVIKACVAANDTWAGASRCYHEWKVYDNRKKYMEEKEFLKENPWYRGNNWDWEKKVGYTCTKLYHKNGMVICHKPIYLDWE